MAGSFMEKRFVEAYEKICSEWRAVPRTDATERETNLFGSVVLGTLQAQLRLTASRGVVQFVPAFLDKSSNGRFMRRSVGTRASLPSDLTPLLPTLASEDDELDPDALLAQFEEAQESAQGGQVLRPAGPVGYRYQTDVLEFRLPRGPMDALALQQGRKPEDLAISSLVTLGTVLSVAVIACFEIDQGDFSTAHRLGAAEHSMFFYDSVPGGNGVSRMLYQDLVKPDSLIWQRISQEILVSTCCHHYCDRCLLLPRTPEFHLSRGLLDKAVLRDLLTL